MNNLFPASNPDSILCLFLLPSLRPKKAQQDCLCKTHSNVNKVPSLQITQGNPFLWTNKWSHLFSACLSRRAPTSAVSPGGESLLFLKLVFPFLDSSDLEIPSLCWALSQPAWTSHPSGLAHVHAFSLLNLSKSWQFSHHLGEGRGDLNWMGAAYPGLHELAVLQMSSL